MRPKHWYITASGRLERLYLDQVTDDHTPLSQWLREQGEVPSAERAVSVKDPSSLSYWFASIVDHHEPGQKPEWSVWLCCNDEDCPVLVRANVPPTTEVLAHMLATQFNGLVGFENKDQAL